MNDKERQELEALRLAAKEFIRKCDAGQAFSSNTYKALKDALAIGEQ
jgi:hypothetical protein